MASVAEGSTLLSVIVGGVVATGGGVVGAWVQSWLQNRSARLRLRADKLQELVTAVYEHEHWMDRYRSQVVFSSKLEMDELNPFAKIQTLTAIYFPQFSEQISKLEDVAMALQSWALEAGHKRLGGSSDFQDGLADVMRPYITARRSLLNDLQKLAKEEFQ